MVWSASGLAKLRLGAAVSLSPPLIGFCLVYENLMALASTGHHWVERIDGTIRYFGPSLLCLFL